jgi:hypothetical protein
MAEGTKVGYQGNIAQVGNSELFGDSTTLDILTLTQVSTTATGDYLVCQDSAGTEKLVFSSAGALTITGAFGCNGQTARASATVSAAIGSVSGSFGCSSSADWILLVAMINNIRTALVSCGICSSTA